MHNRLSRYPYHSASGNYISLDAPLPFQKNIRFDLENKMLIGSPSLVGNHFNAKIRPSHMFYFQMDYFQLLEHNLGLHRYDHLSLFNFNVGYDRVRSEKFNLGWTLGANYIANDVNKGGISVGLNAEVFIVKPISLLSSIKWGLVNQSNVNEFEAQAKYYKKNYYFNLGYEHLKIATPTYNFFAMGFGIHF